MMKIVAASLTIGFLILTCPAKADDAVNQKLAKFFGVEKERIFVECPQQSFSLEDKIEPVLNICLKKLDKQKRCEIAVHNLKRVPAAHNISYEISVKDPQPRREWQSFMQIHSFPDKGEAWRCPVAALEAEDGTFRIYNRWDASALSLTTGHNCTEPGSSISGRSILQDVSVMPGAWQKVNMDVALSTEENGHFQAKIGPKDSGLINGPNTFNDKKDPFLKFGIYKPTSWEKGHVETCVQYRKVEIVTHGD